MNDILYTERLMLRPFKMTDTSMFYLLCKDKEVMKYIGDGSILSLKKTSYQISKWIEQYNKFKYSLLAVIKKNDGQLIGFCGLLNQSVDGVKKIELGYRLGKDYWNYGYAHEAAFIMKNHAFRHLGIRELISIIQPENKRSIKIAEKLGMDLLKKCYFNGQRVSIYYILNEEK